jgi:hypothetical protein
MKRKFLKSKGIRKIFKSEGLSDDDIDKAYKLMEEKK